MPLGQRVELRERTQQPLDLRRATRAAPRARAPPGACPTRARCARRSAATGRCAIASRTPASACRSSPSCQIGERDRLAFAAQRVDDAQRPRRRRRRATPRTVPGCRKRATSATARSTSSCASSPFGQQQRELVDLLPRREQVAFAALGEERERVARRRAARFARAARRSTPAAPRVRSARRRSSTPASASAANHADDCVARSTRGSVISVTLSGSRLLRMPLERLRAFDARLARRNAQVDQLARAEQAEVRVGGEERIPAKMLLDDEHFALVAAGAARRGADRIARPRSPPAARRRGSRTAAAASARGARRDRRTQLRCRRPSLHAGFFAACSRRTSCWTASVCISFSSRCSCVSRASTSLSLNV